MALDLGSGDGLHCMAGQDEQGTKVLGSCVLESGLVSRAYYLILLFAMVHTVKT
jgi:hypothetical protein